MLRLRSQLMLLVIALVALAQAGLFAWFALTADGSDVRSLTLSTGLLAIGCVGLATLAAGFVYAAFLSRVWLRPLQSFATTARRVGMGDYEHELSSDQPEDFADLALAMNTMQQDIAKREQEVAFHAQFDRLTGLPNRFQAEQALDAVLKRLDGGDVPVSVMLVDLNSFGDIVASFGHEIGDALLAQAAERLRGIVDARHTLARLDGGEFLILLEDVSTAEAEELGEDIQRLLDAGLSVQDVNVSVDANVGISSFPEHGADSDTLILHAAVAKNDARETPRGIEIYEPGKEERYVRQLAILGDLRRAVREHELKLYLQPKVQLSDGMICGAEALVRWDHPTLGFLPPQDFIGIAERSGNIPMITQWALETAIRECRLWLEEGLDIPVSVNLTGEDLLDPKLPVFILETLRDHDLDPRYLTLEITENSLVRDFDYTTVVLQCLRDLGTRIAIDDFGTGHSSLAWLKNLPVDELKIDRSFVQELPDNRKDVAIVRATIELAHNLGLTVLAEGVETRPAMRWLASQGCEKAQGFFISRPMPAETFSQWVKHFSGDVTAYVSVIDAIAR
ncbi:MAG: EAL domain-containing protein [Gammaproteobacteria bacterium]|nr:EAL domain-containing protein [Gammaproteobacteria bacterium]MBT8443159.1 EAL domain-containing protein [Gammaproteobacteria bacterium]NND36090.1 EAL domain-containing protein [Gammaproteobacteria bacterium]